MNLVLFDSADTSQTLPVDDPRSAHIRDVLRMGKGDTLDVGLVGGPRGKGTITADDKCGITLAIVWGETPPPPMPISLLVGLPRPQTARKILRECTSLGVAAVHFFRSSKGERAYQSSRLWTTDEWRRHLREGAEQAFTTHVPTVEHFDNLSIGLDNAGPGIARVALDVYEASGPLGQMEISGDEIVLAIGPERGWSKEDRQTLRSHAFTLAHLGQRVLRTETACVAAVSIIATKKGWL